MVGKLLFGMVVYLRTNQGGVFEYDPLVSTDLTCDDYTGRLAQVTMD